MNAVSGIEVQIFTDGGSRGNPGPSAAAFVALAHPSLRPLHQSAAYLGVSTNNRAEYAALILALEWLYAHPLAGVTRVSVFSDSELMVRQITGRYRVKDSLLAPLYARAVSIINQLKNNYKIDISVNHVLRSANPVADSLVNQTLDKHHVRSLNK